MSIKICLMTAGILLLEAIAFTKGQDCETYVTITDSRRSTKQVFDPMTDSPISDNDLDESKWYRFKSYVGNTIPERAENEAVESNRCGTTTPIFISGVGQHPSKDNETKQATVKYNGAWEDAISIHKCPPDENNESFYIYNLVAAPGDQIAYCAGEDAPCNRGYMFNGYTCVDYFPIMKGQPIFSGPHTTGNGAEQQIYFKCQVQYDRVQNDTFARFMITFLFDGSPLEDAGAPHKILLPFTEGPEGEIAANLIEYQLQGRLGKTITCSVRSFWDGNSGSSLSMSSTFAYKATLEGPATFDFDFTRGAEQWISFTSTLPFTYYHCSLYDCALPWIYFFGVETDMATDPDCQLKWINGTVPGLNVYIKPFAGSRIFHITFKPYTGDFVQKDASLWHNYLIPSVTVNAFSSAEKSCTSNSDPHITTFDGKYFDNYYNGDFYLVLGKVDIYTLEVQVRQETCNGNAACNCGVIVREINTVVNVGYNECGKWDSTTARPISVKRLLTQTPYDGTNVTRDSDGRKFSIRLSSGTRVEVDATVPWFNIAVHLAPIYHGKTFSNSSCGNSNGNANDDLTDLTIFKVVDPARSYFNAQPECYEDFFPPAKSCRCSLSFNIVCTNIEMDITKKSPANVEMTSMWSSDKICVDPKSSLLAQHSSGESDADYILDPADLYPPWVPDNNAGHNLTLSWPTPKGKTEAAVEQYCIDLLKGSAVFSDCQTVANTDHMVLQCKSDIQIADEYLSTSSYADAFGQECVNVLLVQEYDATVGGPPPVHDASTIHSNVCPSQCSGHGTCANATCICNAGYIGADCSIDETQPPTATGIIRGGLCDIQERPCATISVFGYGFTSSKNLKCRFLTVNSGSALDNNGALITSSEVSCSVPNIGTERPAVSRQEISIANDGALFSNVVELVTFDSICMSCGQDKVCIQKTDSCLISDRCYASGAMKDTQTCQLCSPSQSTNSWTDMPVTERKLPCSRTCDYGALIKETVCTINNTVINSEPVLCQESSCPAIPEENLQGVIVTLSNEDTTQILLTPTDILSEVAKAVNSYCSTHATECCNSVGIPDGVRLSSFTSTELCSYGSGYPQVGDTSSRIKVIVKLIPSEIQQECVQGVPQNSTAGDQAYADPDIIVTAVIDAKDVLETALNVNIMSVEKDTGSYSGVGFQVAERTSIVMGAVAAFAFIWLI